MIFQHLLQIICNDLNAVTQIEQLQQSFKTNTDRVKSKDQNKNGTAKVRRYPSNSPRTLEEQFNSQVYRLLQENFTSH